MQAYARRKEKINELNSSYMTEQLSLILADKKLDELIPFLKALDVAEKKQLVPAIKKLFKEYTAIVARGNNSYGSRGTAEQQRMLIAAAFVCCDKTEYQKHFYATWIMEEQLLKKILDWYCPDWFGDFVNKLGDEEFIYHAVNYDLIIYLFERGIVQPGKKLIAKILPQQIFEFKDNKWIFVPGNILKNAVTLKEHIWYLFEEESNIHYSNRWLNFDTKEKTGWIELFTTFTAEGRIDRGKLLEETLLASNRNFNKVLSGWFSELFISLDPAETEIISLQKNLFSVLSSPHSKVVNTVLQSLKKIIADKSFDATAFLHSTPALLTSDTKSVVVATLSILEKLAKKNTALRLPVCNAVLQVFIHNNEELQVRAAKIITTHQNSQDLSFTEALQPYYATLLSSAKKLLEGFYTVATETAGEAPYMSAPHYIEERLAEIELPQNIDDLIFLTSQAFDNNQSWHIDILPAALIKWQHHLKGEHIAKLEPALQRALKITKAGVNSSQGSLDHMLAIFFIDVCIHLCRQFPENSLQLQTMFGKYDQVSAQSISRWMAIDEDRFYMTDWDNHYHDPYFTIHKQLLLTTLRKLKEKDDLPLLSTPTHEPAWIVPGILVKRLIEYQGKGLFNIDFQVAVSRCLLKDTDTAIALAEKELKGEHKNLLLFLLGKDKEPKAPFVNTAVWMCCSLALKEKKTYYPAFQNFSFYRKPFESYTGQFAWKSIEEEYEIDRYDYQEKKTFKEKRKRKIITIDINRSNSTESAGLKKFFSSVFQKQKEEQVLVYDYLTIKAQWLAIENDIRRILLLTPNNPEAFLAEIIQRTLKYPDFFSEGDKRTVIACLQLLSEIWDDYGEMAYLFLATCMMASDKTVVNIAGETWLKAVSTGKMNNALLGKIIGRHESIEFAPVKRFTDMFSQSLFRVSALHDKNLKQLIESILIELPGTPIKNLKKLLEIYMELIQADKTIIHNRELAGKLNVWIQHSTLQKIIKNILG